MNRIEFNWMTVKNFFSVGAEIKIDFHEQQGMTYIYGVNKDLNVKNGSGKSTIMCDALLFALFNKTVKKVNKNSIPHRLVKKNAEVKLNFSVDGETYTVVNSVLPTCVKLFCGEDEITKSTIKETYDFIEKEIVKSSYLMFKNSLILSITGNKNIFDMSKYEKRQFIEQMMDFSQIGKMYQMTKDDLNTLDKELNVKRSNVFKLEQDIETFKKKNLTFEEDKKEELKNLRISIQTLQEESQGIKTEDPKLIEVLNKIDDTLLDKKSELKELKTNKEKFNSIMMELNSDVKSVNAIKGKYSDIIGCVGKCCVDKVNGVLGIDTLQTQIEEGKKLAKEAKADFDRVKKDIEKLEDLCENLGQKKHTVTSKITELKSNKQLLDRLQQSITEKQDLLKKESQKVSPFEELIQTYSDDYKVFSEELTEMADKRKYLDFMTFVFSEDGVKKHLIADLINILNNRIRKYLEEMGCEYTAIFDTNFDCEFLTTTGPCEYDNFSAGERVRIDTACLFAFRDLLFGQGTLQSNILICDEILDSGLDEYAINSIIKILKDTSQTQNVFIISHRACVNPEDFDRVLLVEKQNGYTTLKRESDLEDE